jgi:hypothetical protein
VIRDASCEIRRSKACDPADQRSQERRRRRRGLPSLDDARDPGASRGLVPRVRDEGRTRRDAFAVRVAVTVRVPGLSWSVASRRAKTESTNVDTADAGTTMLVETLIVRTRRVRIRTFQANSAASRPSMSCLCPQ